MGSKRARVYGLGMAELSINIRMTMHGEGAACMLWFPLSLSAGGGRSA